MAKIVCYRTDGVKFVLYEDVPRSKLNEMYRQKQKAAEEDPQVSVTKLSTTSFEVCDDGLPYTTTYVLRGDGWPSNHGEPL
jgi:hypothetical protein